MSRKPSLALLGFAYWSVRERKHTQFSYQMFSLKRKPAAKAFLRSGMKSGQRRQNFKISRSNVTEETNETQHPPTNECWGKPSWKLKFFSSTSAKQFNVQMCRRRLEKSRFHYLRDEPYSVALVLRFLCFREDMTRKVIKLQNSNPISIPLQLDKVLFPLFEEEKWLLPFLFWMTWDGWFGPCLTSNACVQRTYRNEIYM